MRQQTRVSLDDPKNSTGHFNAQMKRLANNFTDLSPAAWVDRANEFKRVYDEIGGERFERTVTRVIDEHRDEYGKAWSPKVAEFRSYIVAPLAMSEPRKTCPKCKDMCGFVYVSVRNCFGDERQAVKSCTHEGGN